MEVNLVVETLFDHHVDFTFKIEQSLREVERTLQVLFAHDNCRASIYDVRLHLVNDLNVCISVALKDIEKKLQLEVKENTRMLKRIK